MGKRWDLTTHTPAECSLSEDATIWMAAQKDKGYRFKYSKQWDFCRQTITNHKPS